MTRSLMPVLTGDRPQLVAFDAGTNPRDSSLNPLRVESDDVRRWIERRNPRAIGRWDSIGPEEYARSFAAARSAGQDVIDDLYFAFYDVVAGGGTERDFENMVLPIMRRKGWLADRPAGVVADRVRLIYDTNLKLARSSGKWSRYWASRTGLPYLRGVTGRDERVRHPPKSPLSDHRAWEGIILPIEHPFWTRWFPPLGFRCRCNVIQMTRSQLARFKGGMTSESELAAREAQLGTPIFAAPAAGIEAQLGQLVDATNRESMPGARTIDPSGMIAQGEALWLSVLGAEAQKGLDDLLARIFGQAA